jgi:hypothetical protein
VQSRKVELTVDVTVLCNRLHDDGRCTVAAVDYSFGQYWPYISVYIYSGTDYTEAIGLCIMCIVLRCISSPI